MFWKHFFDQLRAHVFKFVFQGNLFGDCHTVFCGKGGAESLFDDDIAAFWTKVTLTAFARVLIPLKLTSELLH